MFHSLSFLHQKETWSIDVLFQSSAWPSFKMQIQFDTFENKHKIFFLYLVYIIPLLKNRTPHILNFPTNEKFILSTLIRFRFSVS